MGSNTLFRCQQCGHESGKWMGRCPGCGTWSSMVEETVAAHPVSRKSWQNAAPTPGDEPQRLDAITVAESERRQSGISEFDRVLGGGFVPASVVLLAGEPGVGKSTLVLQALASVGTAEHPVLYVTGEESLRQVKLRADRLGIKTDAIAVAMDTDVEKIMRSAAAGNYPLVAVDSVQVAADPLLDSLPGSISQVRQVAARLQAFAKESGQCVLLVGHVTKEGAVAGPRVLEHIVDAVLMFEGERGYPYRILRATKNRFGSTNEVGVFEMTSRGLSPVDNPSAMFLAERPADASGSAVVVTMEGSRPLLMEVQALVAHSGLSTPRRTALGVDYQRVALLAAVLEKKAGIETGGFDVFVNVAGGFRISEPACDLGLCAALASSYIERPVPHDCVLMGEIGLTGEIRTVPRIAERLREAQRLGFTAALLPRSARETAARELGESFPMALKPVSSLAKMMEELF